MFNFKSYVKYPWLGEILNHYYQKELPHFKRTLQGFVLQKNGCSTVLDLEGLINPLQTQALGLSQQQLDLLDQVLIIEEKLTPFWRLYEEVSYRNGKLYLFQPCAFKPQCFHQLIFPLEGELTEVHYSYQERLRTFNAIELVQESWGTVELPRLVTQWKEKIVWSEIKAAAHRLYELFQNECGFALLTTNFHSPLQKELMSSPLLSIHQGRFQKIDETCGLYQLPIESSPLHHLFPERMEQVMNELRTYPYIQSIEENVGFLWVYFDLAFENDLPRDVRLQVQQCVEDKFRLLLNYFDFSEVGEF